MRGSLKVRCVALLLMVSFAGSGAASQPDVELRGSWRATAGARVFQGTWTAIVNSKTPDVARGSWTLIEANRARLQGTWSAEKVRAGWRGTWSARVAPGRPGSPPLTGTWHADVKDATLKTLADMLHRTTQAQVDGTWRRGSMTGTWSLVGSPQQRLKYARDATISIPASFRPRVDGSIRGCACPESPVV